MYSEALKPGAVLGPYPERRCQRRNPIDQAVHNTVRRMANRRWLDRRRARRFAERVEQYGAPLRSVDARELVRRVRSVREELLQRGLVEDLVATAFALVREIAERTLGTRHYQSQVIGGWIILNGMLAEMETGEGKTLTATLPASVAALAGIPVHVITTNDYLAKRDAETMSPLYAILGLSVGTVSGELADPDARRAAYACDITYCTNKQVAFDYLRDRVAAGQRNSRLDRLLDLVNVSANVARLPILRGLCFGIVDEADSVLIDEAEQLCQGANKFWKHRRRREDMVTQALRATHLFVRDEHYLVDDGKVQIIDENTGRLMPDRSWEQGLHQLIEAREQVEITPGTETLARISYQQFFHRYLRLGAMTGTATEVAREMLSTYGLRVVKVDSHRPLRRIDNGTHVFATAEQKWQSTIERIRELRAMGRPVLIGTRSVATSEYLSARLADAGLEHSVLNARHDTHEAQIIAQAGQTGRITIATNMAGRGTDIVLGDGVVECGGLHVVMTEHNDARRIDRQLCGRCGRQGDPGSYEAFLSLEDEIVNDVTPRRVRTLLHKIRVVQRPIFRRPGKGFMRLAQRAVEKRHLRMRRRMHRVDEQIADAMSFTGAME